MYAYYGLSTLGPRMRPYLWWKKYLTTLQMAQLSLISAHGVHFLVLPSCNVHGAFAALVIFFASLNLALFALFFRRSYSIPTPCIKIE